VGLDKMPTLTSRSSVSGAETRRCLRRGGRSGRLEHMIDHQRARPLSGHPARSAGLPAREQKVHEVWKAALPLFTGYQSVSLRSWDGHFYFQSFP
jgi:hypothetical protein